MICSYQIMVSQPNQKEGLPNHKFVPSLFAYPSVITSRHMKVYRTLIADFLYKLYKFKNSIKSLLVIVIFSISLCSITIREYIFIVLQKICSVEWANDQESNEREVISIPKRENYTNNIEESI